ncbi:T9SS type A sorting domain-containing protein [bacterium]|nr:T9SS type A sorting domain-containing protein [bacterium]
MNINNKFLILALTALVFGSVSLCLAGGGPDEYGYVWEDDSSASVDYEWVDTIGATKTLLTGDDEDIFISIPFVFSFYGEECSTAYASSNGILAFADTISTEFRNDPIPNADQPNNAIYVYWDDGNVRGESYNSFVFTKLEGVAPNRRFTVIWSNIFFPYSATTNPATFEVTLFENDTTDGDILLQYKDVEVEDDWYSYGNSASIGIENIGGTIGLGISYNHSSLRNEMAIKITKMPLDYDLTVTKVLVPYDMGLVGFETAPSVVIRNNGMYHMSDAVATLILEGDLGGVVYDEEMFITVLSGETDTIIFPDWTPSMIDSVKITADVNHVRDRYPTNDTLEGHINVYEHISEGGPDSYGYMWRDSYHPEGPEYTPIDITGAVLFGFSGDDARDTLPLPFSFNFYGEDYDTLYISSNGFLSVFPLTSSSYINYCLPDLSEPNGLICPYWDDLNINDTLPEPSGIYLKSEGTTPERKFHIIFWNIYAPYFSESDKVTFEVIICEDNSMIFNYKNAETPSYIDYSWGRSASIGIENQDATAGLSYECDGSPEGNIVFSEFSIMFFPGLEDLTAPTISHTPVEVYYEGAEPFVFTTNITDVSGVSQDSMYWRVGGAFSAVAPDSVVGAAHYYSISPAIDGRLIEYYFAAVDASSYSNRGTLPATAPAALFSAVIKDPHFFGPGSGGYYYVDSYSDSARAPEYNWIEIDPDEGGFGTNLAIDDDDVSETIALHSEFNFYGTFYSNLKIGVNGWISFDTTITEDPFVFSAIPNSEAPNTILCPWWSDLARGTGALMGEILYYDDAVNNLFIVEWKRVISVEAIIHTITFEAILNLDPDAPDPEIKYQYKTINGVFEGATVGIENESGENGLQYFHDGVPANVGIPSDSLAVLFYNPLLYVDDKLSSIPDKFSIFQNYPNPFNAATSFKYAIPEQGRVFLRIFDITGREVCSHDLGYRKPGVHEFVWRGNDDRGRNLNSGIYFATVQYNDFSLSQKILLIK